MKNALEIREELKSASMKLSEIENEQRVIRAGFKCPQDEMVENERLAFWERRIKEQYGYVEALWWVLRE
jgi:hypothetical protein